MNEFASAIELLRKRQEEYLQKAQAIQVAIEALASQGGEEKFR